MPIKHNSSILLNSILVATALEYYIAKRALEYYIAKRALSTLFLSQLESNPDLFNELVTQRLALFPAFTKDTWLWTQNFHLLSKDTVSPA